MIPLLYTAAFNLRRFVIVEGLFHSQKRNTIINGIAYTAINHITTTCDMISNHSCVDRFTPVVYSEWHKQVTDVKVDSTVMLLDRILLQKRRKMVR